MTEAELLIECKLGLGLSEGTDLDGVLTQKLRAVKSFLLGAGVSAAKLSDPMAIGLIVMGVCDLWNIKSGEVKFSAAFFVMLTQLALRPEPAAAPETEGGGSP